MSCKLGELCMGWLENRNQMRNTCILCLYSWTRWRVYCGGALTDCDRVQERLTSINKKLIKQMFWIE